MIGHRDRRQPELFVAGSLRDLVPEDHVLIRVDKVLDLNWLEAEVAGLSQLAGTSVSPPFFNRCERKS